MVLQSLKMAISAIVSNKMRTFLTTLGIIIGVIALVVLVSLVTSSSSAITSEISNLGMSYLTVNITDDKGLPLRLSDMDSFTENELIRSIAPYNQMPVTAKTGRESDSATLYGVTPHYFDVQGMEIESGRQIIIPDIDSNTYVAVISFEMADELFESMDVIGEYVSLNGVKFLIVGILAETEGMSSFGTSGMSVYIPFTTAARMSDSLTNAVSSFYAAAADENDMDAAEDAMSEMLLDRLNNDSEAYSITNLSMLADAMSNVTGTLSLLLGGIAAISLLVGGIGIMNIMLVSVTERTREIGIRKAIGAGRASIMTQFLIEALVVSLLGCIIGIIISWVILQLVSIIAGGIISFSLSPVVVMLAVIFSVIIGVIFGIYPAHKAATKHPIEALRYDG